jgi:hypothetical protein
MLMVMGCGLLKIGCSYGYLVLQFSAYIDRLKLHMQGSRRSLLNREEVVEVETGYSSLSNK